MVFRKIMVPPMTRAEVSAPIRMAYCWYFGVAPTRYPVFRSCEVVPPLDEAMHTTAATEMAVSIAGTSRRPTRTNTRQVTRRVAMVMPEIGLDDEPTSPVRRDDT